MVLVSIVIKYHYLVVLVRRFFYNRNIFVRCYAHLHEEVGSICRIGLDRDLHNGMIWAK
jgi:hypothetical protein